MAVFLARRLHILSEYYSEEVAVLRVTVVSQGKEEIVLKVEGWVSEENVALLEQEGTRWLQEAGRLVLDLAGVQFIDQKGVALLQGWSGKRLVLCGGSAFVRALLAANGLGQRQEK
jgi:anti-anti-sigma factor